MEPIISLCTLLGVLFGQSAAAAAKPNVVYLMADDLGWGDLSAHGGGVHRWLDQHETQTQTHLGCRDGNVRGDAAANTLRERSARKPEFDYRVAMQRAGII